MLRHTPGLRVPRTRLQLTDMRHQPAGAPPAAGTTMPFTGTLALDGRPVATVTGAAGGAITVDPADPAAAHDGMRAYLAACRLHGQPLAIQRLLQALADEHLLDHAVPRRRPRAAPCCDWSTRPATPVRCAPSRRRRMAWASCWNWAATSPGAPISNGRSGPAPPGSPCPAP